MEDRNVWLTLVKNFVSSLIEQGVVDPKFGRRSPVAVLKSATAARQVREDGDPALIAELEHLKNSEPKYVPESRLRDGSFNALIPTAFEYLLTQVPSGVLSSFAYAAVLRVLDRDDRRHVMVLSPTEAEAFAEMYLAGRDEVDEFLLTSQTKTEIFERVARRTWEPRTRWEHIFVGPTNEYTVVLTTEPGTELPSVVEVTTGPSERQRYDSLASTGEYLGPNEGEILALIRQHDRGDNRARAAMINRLEQYLHKDPGQSTR